MRRQLTEFIDEQTPLLPDDDESDVQPTLGFQRVLQRAVFHVQSSGKKEVTGSNVLVAIFSEQKDRLDIRNHGTSDLEITGGEIEFRNVSFAYGRE